MYSSSASSSSKASMSNNSSGGGGGGGGGLTRYGSAPSSLLNAAADSVTRDFSAIGPSRFFHSESSAANSESNNTKPNLNDAVSGREDQQPFDLQRRSPYGFSSGGASASLIRHSSSPAGFLNHLASTVAADNGFSITRGIGSYNSEGISDHNSRNISRLNSQLSFTRQESTLSRISEEANQNAAAAVAVSTDNVQRKSAHNSYTNAAAGFALGSWDDTNSSMFSVGSSKRAKNMGCGVNDLDAMESEFQFGMPQGDLEMATMENLLHIPQDSIPCKIRAKRGCATHPRSIAERERRTRISGKLKKLQDLVPNMDKQTSYADMLDLAVQHIKCLQNQVQNLNEELEGCTCGCKKSSPDNS